MILSEQQYQQLMSRQATGAAPKESAIAWLLSPHGGGELSKAGSRLRRGERDDGDPAAAAPCRGVRHHRAQR